MTYLIDGNALVALAIKEHEFHHRAARWFELISGKGHSIATSPVTEGTLLRLHMHYDPDSSSRSAWTALETFHQLPNHTSWLDNFSYAEVPHSHLRGHRQVTDAWLVELARRKGGKLATLDAPLATLYPDAVALIPFPF